MPRAKEISLGNKSRFDYDSPNDAFTDDLGTYKHAYECYQLAGAAGLTLNELAERMGESYHIARRHTHKLMDKGIVEFGPYRGAGKRAYKANTYHSHGNAMMLPNVDPNGKDIPAVAILKSIMGTPVGETQLSLHSKKLGYYLGSLARYAYAWKNDPDSIPDKDVRELKLQMREAVKWHTWYVKILQDMLITQDLWDRDEAYNLWYTDLYANIEFEDVLKILTSVINQIREPYEKPNLLDTPF